MNADVRPACPVTRVLSVIGGKWKIQILWCLTSGVHRYGALRRAVPGISERMLIRALRELERDGLVARTAYPEVPPRVEYGLTDRGHSLTPVLNDLADWGAQHV